MAQNRIAAKVCALLLLAPFMRSAAGASDAGGLGRLFLSPVERSAIDRIRRGEPAAAQAGPGSSLTGYVKRSDGRNTVWLSGVPYDSGPRQAPTLQPSQVQGGMDRGSISLSDQRARVGPPARRRPATPPARP